MSRGERRSKRVEEKRREGTRETRKQKDNIKT